MGNENHRFYCEEDGCNGIALSCELPPTLDDPSPKYNYYCAHHAQENGYCSGCGVFIAGISVFTDYCDHCQSEIEEPEIDEYDIGYFPPGTFNENL